MGWRTLAVYSEADRDAPHVLASDEAVLLGPAPVAESYLRIDKILAAARGHGATVVHPGYGLLSENPVFAAACENAGIQFAGPNALQMEQFGLKHTARALAEAAGLPLLSGSGLLDSLEAARAQAEKIGYPVMLKSTAGGGGIGMALAENVEALDVAFDRVARLGQSNFGNSGCFLEKFIARARHIEVQIFGDGTGQVLALGERDCSAQRRNQKVIEETPAPHLPEATRRALHAAAVRLGESVGYRSAGTVEFLYDADADAFYFLEVNTRLQVEHPVTEAVTGIDLVEWMLRLAISDNPLSSPRPVAPGGHAIEARLYAEDPRKNFQPSSGLLTEVVFSPAARTDTWIAAGTEVTPYYDPLLAKIIVHAETRAAALEKLQLALAETQVAGIETNLSYLRQLSFWPEMQQGTVCTRSLAEFPYAPATFEILSGGTQTTVQDYPGRLGFWNVGVPPSGPMDALAFRLANRLAGNDGAAAALEITLTGPRLVFHCAATIVLTGPDVPFDVNGMPAPLWEPVDVPAGAIVQIGKIAPRGTRVYLAIRGGIDVPVYLGSRATFTLGQFGGHGGRALRAGDVLAMGSKTHSPASLLPPVLRPVYTNLWELSVLPGPHQAPDYFTPDDMRTLYAASWEVHFQSSRTGVRLIGPRPQWARQDGGEAGLHPSNIHDNAYAIGAVDFTGDMPVILGPDGPSLGGFVCPVTVARCDLWKLGQLRAGDRVRFIPINQVDAVEGMYNTEQFIQTLQPSGALMPPMPSHRNPISGGLLHQSASGADALTFRQSGDDNLLIEFGAPVLDLLLRAKVHVLQQWLEKSAHRGIYEVTPGIRSLQIRFDPARLSPTKLIDTILVGQRDLPAAESLDLPTRIVHLPLSWDDPSTRLAIEKYTSGVRPDAPWCPSNIEFIRRINGLDSIDDVKRIVFEASYLVMGLGDVYLGAPVATPLDPRHRLVTTKYNPARTWTPENAVGIGGAYMCIYGMEGPGGYQFVGRTLQMWNRFHQTREFTPGHPWLLRFFDQIRFYEVSAEELTEIRRNFPLGRYPLRIEEGNFHLGRYTEFLQREQSSIDAFKARQQMAFAAERQRWESQGQMSLADEPACTPDASSDIPDGCLAIESEMSGSVWKILVAQGQSIAAGEKVAVLEAMKMEIDIHSPEPGIVESILVSQGRPVMAGQALMILRS